MTRRNFFVLLALIVGLVLGPLVATAKTTKRRVLVYSGSLQDERGGAIGGVFPLTFALYNKARGGKSLWSETHFVGVDNGQYLVELGRKKLIPKKVKLDQLYVGVRVTGGPEVVRERFVAEGAANEEIIHQAGRSGKAPVKTAPGGKGGVIDYAEKAGFAYVSEKADNAERLEGMTLDQLKKSLGGSAKIGRKRFDAQSAGGDGGTPFEQLCPEGYVVTGLRGGSGLYIDRVSIICSPLGSK